MCVLNDSSLMLYKMFEVLFDPRKPTDIRKTSAMDFAVRRTGKLNKISYNSLTNYFHTIQTALHAAGGLAIPEDL